MLAPKKDRAYEAIENKMLSLFKKYDADNSKSLDKAELRIMFQDLCDIMDKPIFTEEQFNIIYSKIDDDDNGTIDYDEFKAKVGIIISFIDNLNVSSRMSISLRNSLMNSKTGELSEV